jgi:hypothetical protein
MELHQNKCHPGGVPGTRMQGAKAADQWAQGVTSRPNPLAGRPHIAASSGLAHGDTLQEAV